MSRPSDPLAKHWSGFVLTLIVALACLGTTQRAMAAQEAAGPGTATGDQRFAVVWRVSGEVHGSSNEAGQPRRLRTGDVVLVGERLQAQTASEAVLKTDDGGWLALRPGTLLVTDRFQANRTFVVRLLAGPLRWISGRAGQGHRDGYQVQTPTATIGIRGTDHEPYVMTDELAAALAQPAGTYDKVNRGGTTLEVQGQRLEVNAGQVGFVHTEKSAKTRGLMTLLLPVLLDKVPTFYVPGRFDAELDRLSLAAESESAAAPAARRQPSSAQAGSAADAGRSTASAVPARGACAAPTVASRWLGQFDAAVTRRNASAVLRLFAPDVVIRANLRDSAGGSASLDVSRDEWVKSVVAATQGVTELRQRRLSIEGKPQQPDDCGRIEVKSLVLEQGKRNGNPFRFESIEVFVLEKRAGQWLAIQAETTPQ